MLPSDHLADTFPFVPAAWRVPTVQKEDGENTAYPGGFRKRDPMRTPPPFYPILEILTKRLECDPYIHVLR